MKPEENNRRKTFTRQEPADNCRELADNSREPADNLRELADNCRELADNSREFADNFRGLADNYRSVFFFSYRPVSNQIHFAGVQYTKFILKKQRQ